MIGDASIAKQCRKAGLADELHVDIGPVLPSDGTRVFEDLGTESMQLETINVMELPGGRTQVEFRIVK